MKRSWNRNPYGTPKSQIGKTLEIRRQAALLAFRWTSPKTLPSEKRAALTLWLGDPSIGDLELVERSNRRGCPSAQEVARARRRELRGVSTGVIVLDELSRLDEVFDSLEARGRKP